MAPAARLANRHDTRIGATLADAVSCNVVVKVFGAESREDRAFGRVLAKWSRRTRRQWQRGTFTATGQLATLLVLRGAVIASVLVLYLPPAVRAAGAGADAGGVTPGEQRTGGGIPSLTPAGRA